uniref:Lactamase_B domain-containing protein n=1 Tax=Caenorhabditis japonica TaxID=281687 RepID=A0A8R1EBI1_CAEJA
MPTSTSTSTVLILIQGRPNDDPLGATGTVGLCIDKDTVVLIDAGDPWNGNEIIERLKFVEREVTHVVITHGHLDHCANMGLFPEAVQIMDHDVAVKRGKSIEYSTISKWPYRISENVEVRGRNS